MNDYLAYRVCESRILKNRKITYSRGVVVVPAEEVVVVELSASSIVIYSVLGISVVDRSCAI